MARLPKNTVLCRVDNNQVERGKAAIITLIEIIKVDILVAGMAASRILHLKEAELGLSILAADRHFNPVVSTFDENDDLLLDEYGTYNTVDNSVESFVEGVQTPTENLGKSAAARARAKWEKTE